MKGKKPVLVTVIGDLNIISVFFIILSFFSTPEFIKQLGFSFLPVHGTSDGIMRMLEAVILLIITYEFLKLKKLGYWLMITYYLFFLAASIISVLLHNKQFASFFIPSLLEFMIIFPSKRYFIEEKLTS